MFLYCSHPWRGVGVCLSEASEEIMEPSDDRVPSPPMTLAALRLTRNVLPDRLRSLLRALELAATEGWGFGARDVVLVESDWVLLEDDANAHGVVHALRDGRRLSLQYSPAWDR